MEGSDENLYYVTAISRANGNEDGGWGNLSACEGLDVHTDPYVCMYVCMSVCLYVRTYVRMYVRRMNTRILPSIVD